MTPSIDEALRAHAGKYQAALMQPLPTIESRIKQLETELTEQRAALIAARWSEALLRSYTPSISGQNRCPYCWVGRSVISPLQFEECFKDEKDILKCPSCGREISIPSSATDDDVGLAML